MARVLETLNPPDGGAAEHVRVLSLGLLERGHEVEVAGPPESPIYGPLREAGAVVHPIPIVGSIFAPRTDLATIRALRRVVAQGSFDLVHAHSSKAGALTRAALAASRLPVLYTPHCFAFEGNEYRAEVSRPRLRSATVIAIERALGPLTRILICVSEYERGLAARHHICRRSRRRVVYSGVEVDAGARPDPELLAWRGEEGPLLGTVVSLREQKGLPFLVDAAARLEDLGPPPRIAIVGEGPMRAELERRIEALSLGERVRVFPYSGRVEPHLLALDGFVLPSLWEGLPIALLEAMACGLAVVASDVGGMAEAVEDGVSGLIVPPADPDALARGLMRLAEDPEGRAEMGRRGRERIERRFQLGRMVDEIEALYLEVLGAGRPQPSAAQNPRATERKAA